MAHDLLLRLRAGLLVLGSLSGESRFVQPRLGGCGSCVNKRVNKTYLAQEGLEELRRNRRALRRTDQLCRPPVRRPGWLGWPGLKRRGDDLAANSHSDSEVRSAPFRPDDRRELGIHGDLAEVTPDSEAARKMPGRWRLGKSTSPTEPSASRRVAVAPGLAKELPGRLVLLPDRPAGREACQLQSRMSRCVCVWYSLAMPKTVQIRDLDDEVYAALVRRAAEAGVSVPELLREAALRLASRPSMGEWLERTRRRSSPLGRVEILAALDEQRGPWPDVGG